MLQPRPAAPPEFETATGLPPLYVPTVRPGSRGSMVRGGGGRVSKLGLAAHEALLGGGELCICFVYATHVGPSQHMVHAGHGEG